MGEARADPQQAEGRAIYFGAARQALAGTVAGVAARALPCANCHGRDGGGGAEGAQRIPPIDRESLAGRGYDQDAFAAALSHGRAPGGRALALAMPRYAVTPDQAQALWRFLSVASAEDASGVSTDAVIFLIPASGAHMKAAASLEAALAAAFAETGRLFGRCIVVRMAPVLDGAPLPPGFAALGLALDDAPAREATLRAGLPVIAPRGDATSIDLPADTVFIQAGEDAVHAGLRSRDAEAAAGADGGGLVVPDAAALRRLAESAGDMGDRRIVLSARLAEADPDAVARLRRAGARITAFRPAGDPTAWPQVSAVITALVRTGLLAAGRPLTRRSFLAGLRTASVAVPPWPPLDYRQVPVRGTTQIESTEISP